MTIVVVNPNRVARNTEYLQESLDQWFPGQDIVAVNPQWGPTELAGEYEVQLSAFGVMNRIATFDGTVSGVVMAGFAEPGLEALREMVGVPVVDITEAGPMTAMLLGRRYGIVTSSFGAVPIVEDRLVSLGLGSRCAKVVAAGLTVPEMMQDRSMSVARIIKVGRKLINEYPCAALVLGCGGFTGLGSAISDAIGVPVIEPVHCAVTMVRGLLELRPTSTAPPGRSTSELVPMMAQGRLSWPPDHPRHPGEGAHDDS